MLTHTRPLPQKLIHKQAKAKLAGKYLDSLMPGGTTHGKRSGGHNLLFLETRMTRGKHLRWLDSCSLFALFVFVCAVSVSVDLFMCSTTLCLAPIRSAFPINKDLTNLLILNGSKFLRSINTTAIMSLLFSFCALNNSRGTTKTVSSHPKYV